MNQEIIEERLERIAQMLDSATDFIDELDINVPEQAKKMIIDILKSKEIKSIVEDIQNKRHPRIVIMGRSGVGKSSLINAMFGAYLAETSAVEVGTTEYETFQYKKNGKVIFEMIDTRGLKENIQGASHSAEEDLNKLIEDFQPDAFLYLTGGAERSGMKEDAKELNNIFHRMSIKPPLITVVTRVDEIEPARIKDPAGYTGRKKENIKQKERQVKHTLEDAGITDMFIVSVSSYIEWNHEDPEGLSLEDRDHVAIAFDGRYHIDQLMDILEENVDFNVALDLMFNRRIDRAVEKIANIFVKRFSAASAVVGASPMPVTDILVLLPVQITEVVLVAYLSGNKVDGKTAREFIVSLGAVSLFGFGLRFVAQQGVKLLNVVPGAGSTISATIAYSGTYSIGKAAISYYIKDLSLNESKKEAESAKKEIETDGKEVIDSDEETGTEEPEKEAEQEMDTEINDETVMETENEIKPKRKKTKKFWDKFNINRRNTKK